MVKLLKTKENIENSQIKMDMLHTRKYQIKWPRTSLQKLWKQENNTLNVPKGNKLMIQNSPSSKKKNHQKW